MKDITKSISTKFQLMHFEPVEFFASLTEKDVNKEDEESVKESLCRDLAADIKKQKDFFLKLKLEALTFKKNKTEADTVLENRLVELLDQPF